MPLHIEKLEKVKQRGNGSVIARCPACAAGGLDRTGNHLKIWPDGHFACVVNTGPAGAEHRKEIWRLAGLTDGKPAARPGDTGTTTLFADN